jgi:hypothetical protein
MSARCRLIGLSLESALTWMHFQRLSMEGIFITTVEVFSEHAHAGLGPAWPDSSYFGRCLVFHSLPASLENISHNINPIRRSDIECLRSMFSSTLVLILAVTTASWLSSQGQSGSLPNAPDLSFSIREYSPKSWFSSRESET